VDAAVHSVYSCEDSENYEDDMNDILARLKSEKWQGCLWIDFRQDLPFLFMLDYTYVGRGKTAESAMIEAIQAMDAK